MRKIEFAKSLLLSAVIFLLIGLVVSVSLFMRDIKYSDTLNLMDNVAQSYQTKDQFTFEDQFALEEMIVRNSKWFDNISYFALLQDSEADGKRTIKKVFTHGLENTGESPMMRVDYRGNFGTEWRAEWQYKTYSFLKYEFLYYVFFAISGILFILWGVFCFYNRNRLKAIG
ncbi:hypothetical protein M3193_03605 [Sporosarcina luteola]|uniref:hypothetical protein n=1 Tax=Sporosarcina luteola TaxID=582850 RepID=UPI0020420081|nr:hypothetical protein [Sporosarcina luteola]MCM3743219.1 hypothetical protein [Sporosarcina luteola]